MIQQDWRIQVCGQLDVAAQKHELVEALEAHFSHNGETCAIDAIEVLACPEDETLTVDAIVEVVRIGPFELRHTNLHVSILPVDMVAIQIAFADNGSLHLRNLNTYESDIFSSHSAHGAFVQHLQARIRSARTNRAIRSAHSMITDIEAQLRARS